MLFEGQGTNYLGPELRLSSRHCVGLQKGQLRCQLPLPQTKGKERTRTGSNATHLTEANKLLMRAGQG